MSDIAVDTSAIVEKLIEGPHADAVRDTLATAGRAFVTSAARVETALVMMGRFGWDRATFDRAWQALGLEEVAVDSSIAALAIDAFEMWGKGRAKAGLNFGDCFSHALVVARHVPLLYVGDDFGQTNLQRPPVGG
ncbi:MAG: type II toxin-antitoxin system VapC family toxin [Rhodospirillales bacterium]|nr:type II toxin-antitoxin system VapC family toxin [Rhodospirillales bacterium]